ncbi:MAG: hydantoinase B/oxoprolinase family protein [Cyanobacteriota bacterium]
MALASAAGWRFWIDRGGTFTDLVACSPTGELQVRKLLSQPPGAAGDPAVAAIADLLGLDPMAPLPSELIAEVRLGTTVATNALLERRGSPTLLLINAGFADALRLGDQSRPELVAREIVRPQPLFVQVIEVGGRLAADGTELEPLRLDHTLERRITEARAAGLRSCAVVLLHGHRHPHHERQLGAWLERFDFEVVALSHRVSPLQKLVPRGHTTVIEAFVAPALDRYLQRVQADLGRAVDLRVMQSSGGLIAPAALRAKDTILSGPAGGLVGAVAVARQAGLRDRPILGFDMGGTSTDAFHLAAGADPAAWEGSAQATMAGLPLQATMLPIHTVAAGGGSLIRWDGLRLRVGPASAGADPGPAAYGRGGPLTVTDANVLLGRIQPAHAPRLFGPQGDQALDPQPVRVGFEALARAIGRSAEAVAAGALDLAVARMAAAIRLISIQRGHDIAEAVLVSYGGAGGQHACALAEQLGVRRILLHPLAGVLSAYGIGLASERLLLEHPIGEPLTLALRSVLQQAHQVLLTEGQERLIRSSTPPVTEAGLTQRLALAIRPRGGDDSLIVPWDGGLACEASVQSLAAAHGELHRRRFGFAPPLETLVVDRLLLDLELPAREVASAAATVRPASVPVAAVVPEPAARVKVFHGERWQVAPLHRRQDLLPGQRLQGLALLVEPTSTVLLAPGWELQVLADGAWLLEQHPAMANPLAADRRGLGAPAGGDRALAAWAGADPVASSGSEAEIMASALVQGPTIQACDPLLLELFQHRFTAIAEQMGLRLQQTSRSVNIRERLDFSCALFDGQGRLLAKAPHIPVHLGSMGESVTALLAAVAEGRRPPLKPWDARLTNTPFNGGTHLPDLTLITPVFADEAGDGGRPWAFVACRGHYADVGGITPGSMPPFSTTIEEEGLLFDHESVLEDGRLDREAWLARLAEGPWPVRNPEQFLADLTAQVAANQLGRQELRALMHREGLPQVQAYMAHGLAQGAEAVRRVIDRLQDGAFVSVLDDGSRIAVAVRIDRRARRAVIDFAGTSPQQPGNRNAPLAITRAAVLYVFRTLVSDPIPLNAGCFEPLTLKIPPGCLLAPRAPAAVVAGSVETSQAVGNALSAARGVRAAGQGTMNNLSFGDEEHAYSETLCGGTGAGLRIAATGVEGFAGADAVQSHMTNSRLTDPEVLEDRFPVRLESFRIRRGSGGAGRGAGGDGVVRRLRVLAPLTVAMLAGSRRQPPFGLAGGAPGRCGRNRLERLGGAPEPLPGSWHRQLEPGDLLEIATPGGGGYGPVTAASRGDEPGRPASADAGTDEALTPADPPDAPV